MGFNLFDYPIVGMAPDRLTSHWSWSEHIPFAFLLIDLLRPRTLVELGTHSGTSYCAFCQAVQKLQLPTRCHAVDTWKGDQHTGSYDAGLLDALRAYHDPRYGSFSQLEPSTFDQAADRFADGSIDLLHIDGLHTYEAVRHDYDTWFGKMSDAGVILMHDTTSRLAGFGVFKLWAEVETQFPSFQFHHGSGLGVLGVGKHLPPAFLEFLDEARRAPEGVREVFTALGRGNSTSCGLRIAICRLFDQQAGVNAYKRQMGERPDPQWQDLSSALSRPVTYVNYTADQVGALLRHTADLARRAEASK